MSAPGLWFLEIPISPSHFLMPCAASTSIYIVKAIALESVNPSVALNSVGDLNPRGLGSQSQGHCEGGRVNDGNTLCDKIGEMFSGASNLHVKLALTKDREG